MYSNNDEFYKKQIITYLGNKRKFVDMIEDIVKKLEKKHKKNYLLVMGLLVLVYCLEYLKTTASLFILMT